MNQQPLIPAPAPSLATALQSESIPSVVVMGESTQREEKFFRSLRNLSRPGRAKSFRQASRRSACHTIWKNGEMYKTCKGAKLVKPHFGWKCRLSPVACRLVACRRVASHFQTRGAKDFPSSERSLRNKYLKKVWPGLDHRLTRGQGDKATGDKATGDRRQATFATKVEGHNFASEYGMRICLILARHPARDHEKKQATPFNCDC
jgi:hypothetical protein